MSARRPHPRARRTLTTRHPHRAPATLSPSPSTLLPPPLASPIWQCGILAFSLVMLNVDAHNDNIPQKKKMTVDQ
jgi:hypothetical protein